MYVQNLLQQVADSTQGRVGGNEESNHGMSTFDQGQSLECQCPDASNSLAIKINGGYICQKLSKIQLLKSSSVSGKIN